MKKRNKPTCLFKAYLYNDQTTRKRLLEELFRKFVKIRNSFFVKSCGEQKTARGCLLKVNPEQQN